MARRRDDLVDALLDIGTPPVVEKVPLRGICKVCGAMLHEDDWTTCELCRGTRHDPEPE